MCGPVRSGWGRGRCWSPYAYVYEVNQVKIFDWGRVEGSHKSEAFLPHR